MKMETRRDARRMSAIIQRLSAETGSNPDGQRAISTGKSASVYQRTCVTIRSKNPRPKGAESMH
jgi:hypothetical protein